MAFKSTLNTRILVGANSLSSKLSSVNDAWNVDMLDPTTFTDSTHRATPGLDSSTFTMEGFVETDNTVTSQMASWSTSAPTPITYGPAGLTLGSPVLLCAAYRGDYEVGTQVAGLASFSISASTDGATDYGVSLHDLTAASADGSGTGHDGTAATSNGGVAQLHVTAYSGLTNAIVTVEDSANNSVWATIATFATVTGTTSERVAITGAVRRYLRYSIDVTGTGSLTFQTSFARR